MPVSTLPAWFRRTSRACIGTRPSASCWRPRLEPLEDRTVPATSLKLVTTPDIAQSYLNATAAISANDVWAVGETIANIPQQPLALHFNGTSWSAVPTPALPSGDFGQLRGVTAVASDNVWAVGETGNIAPFNSLIEHWDGTKWSIVSSPNTSAIGILNAVTAISANNIWAVGSGGLIEHFNGTNWSIVSAPAGTGNLHGVSGSSSSDIWAVGGVGRHPATQVLHFNGTTWSIVSSPSPAFDSVLESVVAIAPNNAWAVGVTNVGPTQTLIEHWNGATWSVVSSPNGGGSGTNANNGLNGVAAVSATNIWAVGFFTDPTTGFEQTLTEHFDGTRWSIIASPDATTNGQNTLNGVTALSTGTVVAVGSAIDGSTGDTNNLVLAQNGGGATSTANTPSARATPTLVASTSSASGPSSTDALMRQVLLSSTAHKRPEWMIDEDGFLPAM